MLLAEKGATYQVTEEDLNDIANEITADANSVFNQNVTSKTNAFDANATSQTSAFNNNANAKTTSYNDNATSALSAYNTNANSKLNAYDKNHNEKVEAYNTNASAKLKEFNDNAESYDERITDNTNRTKRIENTLYDSGEANGTSINIKDSTLAEFQEIVVDGVCEQVTTTGKNNIDKDNYILDTWDNNYDAFQVSLKAGTYTLSSNTTMETIKASNHIGTDWGSVPFGTSEKTKEYTFTISEDYNGGVLIKLDGGLQINHTNIANYDIQLENGSIATDFEPYTGLLPSPSPSYPQPIEVIEEGFDIVSCARNVVEIKNRTKNSNGVEVNVENQTINAKGIINNTWIDLTSGTTTNAHLKKGKVYTLVLNQSLPYTFYGKINQNYVTVRKGQTYQTVTQTEEYKEMYFFVGEITSGTEIDIKDLKVMIYEGEYDATRNDFEPYQESVAPINLKGEFVGKLSETDKDQVRIAFNEEDGQYQPKLSKKLKRIIFTGNEENLKLRSTYNNIAQFELYNSDGLYKQYKAVNVISSHYKGIAFMGSPQGDSWTVDNAITIISGGNIVIMTSQFSTVEEYRAYLKQLYDNGTPLIAYYVLAEPYEIDLGVVDMPLTYSPETNVFTTSELEAIINAKYYRNFINTIQNLQVNEKALKDELVDIQSKLNALMINVSNLSVLATNDEVESEVI
jgi:hypothetical protein